ncbi:MAG: PQQ-binding-like beta-propeller repeat protein [Roseiarcus sp.]
MMRRLVIAALVAAALVVAGAAGAVALFRAYPVRMSLFAAMTRNYLRSLSAPKGATTTELNPAYKGAAPPSPSSAAASGADEDWPSYNRTLTSERYAPVAEINASTVGKLKVLCTYDTKQYTSFESGLIMVEGALIGTTIADIFSIDPATCAENWRTHEDFPPSILSAMRGAAYLDGMLFRGSQDGRVLAYDFKTGKRIWQTTIGDVRRSEFVPGAPIAWNGLVFIGNAGGDAKGGKGHMFALDAKTGKIVWQFFLVPQTEGDHPFGPQGASPLDTSTWINAPGIPISGGASWTSTTLDPATGELYVPVGNPGPAYVIGVRQGDNLFTGSIVVLDAKTGAYKRHFKLVHRDWHDWDVASAPSVIQTAGGKKLLATAPKDGYLYGVDLAENTVIYRAPVTKMENADVPFSVDASVRFCPGATGGSEWNGPAYDPQTNLILTGETEWCTTVKLQTNQQLRDVPTGGLWMGMATRNPFQILGQQEGSWGGWVYAVDADSGVWKWRLRSNYPVVGGVTPTAGGLVFFGDVGGNFYAVDAATGKKLWGRKIGGAIGGGVIAYKAGGGEKIAVTTGLTGPTWPTESVTGKIAVLGLDDAPAKQ